MKFPVYRKGHAANATDIVGMHLERARAQVSQALGIDGQQLEAVLEDAAVECLRQNQPPRGAVANKHPEPAQ